MLLSDREKAENGIETGTLIWPKLKNTHVGATVKTRRGISAGWCEIPKGTVCTVIRSYSGLHLKAKPCECCGISLNLANVDYQDVVLIALKGD